MRERLWLHVIDDQRPSTNIGTVVAVFVFVIGDYLDHRPYRTGNPDDQCNYRNNHRHTSFVK